MATIAIVPSSASTEVTSVDSLQRDVARHLRDLVPAFSVRSSERSDEDLRIAKVGVQLADMALMIDVLVPPSRAVAVIERLEQTYHVLGREHESGVLWLACLVPCPLLEATKSEIFTLRVH